MTLYIVHGIQYDSADNASTTDVIDMALHVGLVFNNLEGAKTACRRDLMRHYEQFPKEQKPPPELEWEFNPKESQWGAYSKMFQWIFQITVLEERTHIYIVLDFDEVEPELFSTLESAKERALEQQNYMRSDDNTATLIWTEDKLGEYWTGINDGGDPAWYIQKKELDK